MGEIGPGSKYDGNYQNAQRFKQSGNFLFPDCKNQFGNTIDYYNYQCIICYLQMIGYQLKGKTDARYCRPCQPVPSHGKYDPGKHRRHIGNGICFRVMSGCNYYEIVRAECKCYCPGYGKPWIYSVNHQQDIKTEKGNEQCSNRYPESLEKIHYRSYDIAFILYRDLVCGHPSEHGIRP